VDLEAVDEDFNGPKFDGLVDICAILLDMSESEPRLPLSRISFGTAESHYALTYPTLESDGSVHFSPEDGTNHTTVTVKSFLHYYQCFSIGVTLAHTLNSMQAEKNTLIIHKMELIITDARIIVHQLDSKHPGKRLIGHLWYPWMSGVGWRPKQSLLNEAALSFEYMEKFALKERGWWWERIELNFDKTVDTQSLAHEIARRLAAHHLANSVPDAAVPELTAMLSSERLDDPLKGEFASYSPAAYVPYPGGVPYVEWKEPIAWDWTLQGAAAKIENAEKGRVVKSLTPHGGIEPETADVARQEHESPATDASEPEAPLPTLSLRDRLSISKDIVVALRAFDAEKFDVAAPLYRSIVDRLTAATTAMTPEQVVDVIERAGMAHAELGLIPEAVEFFERALSIATRARDEKLELGTRQFLADALKKVDSHPLIVPNIARMSELGDSHLTRVERAELHEHLGQDLKLVGESTDALAELRASGDLFEAINDLDRAGNVSGQISQIHFEAGDVEQARVARSRSLKLVRDGGDAKGEARVDSNLLGTVDAAMKRFERSNPERELSLSEDAVEIARAQVARRSGDRVTREALSFRLSRRAELLRATQAEVAVQCVTEAVDLSRVLAAEQPSDAKPQRILAIELWNHGRIVRDAGLPGALESFRESVDMMRAVADRTSEDLSARRILAGTLSNLGQLLLATDGPAAIAALEESVAVTRLVQAAVPDDARDVRALNQELTDLADAIVASDANRAASLRSEVEHNRARLAAGEPITP